MGERAEIECWLTDMDGVLVHEGHALPGAADFLQRLVDRERRFLVLTNNSIFTPRDLAARLARSGLHVPEESIWTSALATADFLADQSPGGSAFVIGEAGLTTALHEAGYTLTDAKPDYVVLGETRTYSFEAITTAIRLIEDGSRFLATNPDATGPSADGPLPATGAVAALITRATGRLPYFIGQAEPDDVPQRHEPDRSSLRDHRDDRGPDGHRCGGGDRGRAQDGARAHRLDAANRHRPVPLPADPRARFHRGRRRPRLSGRLSRTRWAQPDLRCGASRVRSAGESRSDAVLAWCQ